VLKQPRPIALPLARCRALPRAPLALAGSRDVEDAAHDRRSVMGTSYKRLRGAVGVSTIAAADPASAPAIISTASLRAPAKTGAQRRGRGRGGIARRLGPAARAVRRAGASGAGPLSLALRRAAALADDGAPLQPGVRRRRDGQRPARIVPLDQPTSRCPIAPRRRRSGGPWRRTWHGSRRGAAVDSGRANRRRARAQRQGPLLGAGRRLELRTTACALG
jgi:hypothetical protein